MTDFIAIALIAASLGYLAGFLHGLYLLRKVIGGLK